MDFLDPQKQKAHARRLALGYALIGVLLLLSTLILLYQAYGFGIDKNGRVIQKGLVFFSSRPDNAGIYVNGEEKDTTNTGLTLPAGAYTVELKRNGYRDWKRALTVEGGSVERFDYPLLFPSSLKTTVTKQYAAAPAMASQSVDRRWLLVHGTEADTLDLYDLNAKTPVAQLLVMPIDIYTPATKTKSWQAVAWADNDRHVVLKRLFEKDGGATGNEYILFDREEPAKSQNLSILIGFTPTTIELKNGKYDQYYLYDQTAKQLFTATLKKPTPLPLVKDVLAFASEKDLVLYATPDPAKPDKVLLQLRQNEIVYTLRQVPAGTTYLLDLMQYEEEWHVMAGAQSENKVYVYEDPIATLRDTDQILVPVQILKVTAPASVSFSPNGRFALTQNGQQFAIYDAERSKGYAYELKATLDDPSKPAAWLGGFHLSGLSGGKIVAFDYDGTNVQSLQSGVQNMPPFLDRNSRFMYHLTPEHALGSTALLTAADQ